MKFIWKSVRFLKEKMLQWASVVALRMQVSSYNVRIAKPYSAKGIPRIETFRNGKIVIGKNFRFNSGAFFNAIGRNQQLTFQVWGLLEIGDHVSMSGTSIICREKIQIGNHVMIGGNVVIYDTDFHSLDPLKRNQIPEDRSDTKNAAVIIKDGAFIGGHATILKGSVIGENAIVGACSVVTGNIPAGEIWAGNPAKFIRVLDQHPINSALQ
ncbi:MAG TPA: acyltransferase [Ohtaekwangia sp.]|nr:acyltransferase [Ohtaekwangia sp.]